MNVTHFMMHLWYENAPFIKKIDLIRPSMREMQMTLNKYLMLIKASSSYTC